MDNIDYYTVPENVTRNTILVFYFCAVICKYYFFSDLVRGLLGLLGFLVLCVEYFSLSTEKQPGLVKYNISKNNINDKLQESIQYYVRVTIDVCKTQFINLIFYSRFFFEHSERRIDEINRHCNVLEKLLHGYRFYPKNQRNFLRSPVYAPNPTFDEFAQSGRPS